MRILASAFRIPLCAFRYPLLLSLALFALASLSGLEAADRKSKSKDEDRTKGPRTIGDVTAVDGLQPFPVQGVGLVTGLEDTGSDPVPGPDRATLLLEMQKRGIRDTEEILRSPGTALVRVRANVPPGVRSCKSAGCWCKSELKPKQAEGALPRPHKGDTFDVEVEVPERDSAKSLEGGWLLDCWLYEVAAVRGAGTLPGHVRARASGPVLVSSGLDGAVDHAANLRRGRVLGGGISIQDRDFALVTNGDRSARWTLQIATRISDRYHGKTRDSKPVAEAKNGRQVHLKTPPQYRQNIGRYLEVIAHMPIYQSDGGDSDRIKQLEADLANPATARAAALKLEGMGRRGVDTLTNGLASSDADVRFFAAEALAYLNEPACAETLANTAREIAEYRAHALTALSSLDESISRIKLLDLIRNSDSVELRYGAFCALRALDREDRAIQGESLGELLVLHQFATSGKPFIHVSSRNRAEIVLFGQNQQFQVPLLLRAGGKILLSAGHQSPGVQISRFEPGQETGHHGCGLEIDAVIRRTVSLGASYPDVVGMLVQAEQNHNLPGRLEINALPDPTLLVARLQKLSGAAEVPSENLATSNLFHWFEPKKPNRSDRSEESDVATADSEDSGKPRKYLTKPSMLDRLLRRSAN